MNKLRAVDLLALATVVMISVAPAAPMRTAGDVVPGHYIVVLDESLIPNQVAQLQSTTFGFQVDLIYRHALNGYAAQMSAAVAQLVAGLPGVAWVEQDQYMKVSAQMLPTGIDRVDADVSPTAAIDGRDTRVNVDVAVVDTGADLSHPDLNVYRAGAKNCTLEPVEDMHGHGTHVSGTIGALDNSSGVVGIAPGARIWPVKAFTALGSGLRSQVLCGIDYVRSKASQIEVANMSFGGRGSDDGNCGSSNNDALHRAICSVVNAGVTVVVAAGNESVDVKNKVPAAYDEVITVSALSDFNGSPGGGAPATCRSDVDDTFANYSNFGLDVDIMAPGTCIRSTWIAGGYRAASGTSAAAPHVAGAAALYKAHNPAARPNQVKSALQRAGTLNWIYNGEDMDRVQERLLNVTSF